MTWLNLLWAKMRRKPVVAPDIIFYDVSASMKYLYPKPVDAKTLMDMVALGEKEYLGYRPGIRILDRKTGIEITGPIIDEANMMVEVNRLIKGVLGSAHG